MPVIHSSAPVPRLTALATAYPPHLLSQDDVADHAAELFGGAEFSLRHLMPVFRNAQIETRHACTPIEWFFEDHSFSERNALFLDHAVRLLTQAAKAALEKAELSPTDIDTVVTVCTSGIATPALDARLIGTLGLKPNVERLPIFGLGCAGGVLGLARAAALAQAAPRSRVLFLTVELCTLTFRRNDRSKSNMVAAALFGDGAAAAIVTCRTDDPGALAAPRLGPWGEHTWPDSLGVMGWDVAEDGLKVVFSRDIPTLVQSDLRPVIDDFLRRHDWARSDIDGFICHPGGAKVLDALEQMLDLASGGLVQARQVLRDHGNMSAATVLFVLEAMLADRIKGRHLMTSLGPGFTAAMMIVEPAA